MFFIRCKLQYTFKGEGGILISELIQMVRESESARMNSIAHAIQSILHDTSQFLD